MANKSRRRKAGTPEAVTLSDATHERLDPTFLKPPLEEVVFGVRFEPLEQFKLPFLGLFWERFRADYPKVEHASPIISGTTLALDAASGGLLPRIWFINQSDDELIQFQIDQLYYNWRKRQREYPRFKTLFPKFEAAKKWLDELLAELKIGPMVLLEHELTYINHIPKGQGWESISDLPKVLSILYPAFDAFTFLPTPKNIAWNARFDLPDSQGQLDVRLSQALRRSDSHPLFALQLSAKGKPTSASWESTKAWFETAHHWIVNGFGDITAGDIQGGVWGREK